jgi:hypothetical protein
MASAISRLPEENEEHMKRLCLFLAGAIFLTTGGRVLARHVTHSVTPANIEKQPFAFTVKVRDVGQLKGKSKDAGQLKEFEIRVERAAGKRDPSPSASGSLSIADITRKEIPVPAVTLVKSEGVLIFTFQISPELLNRAQFTFTDTQEDWRHPFPSLGDYWEFDLNKFVGSPKK